MTAQAVLNGLYPPAGQQMWKEGLKWQPIPVHTVELQDDVVSTNNCVSKARGRATAKLKSLVA